MEAELCAIFAGTLWAVGALAKRISVHNVTLEQQFKRTFLSTLLYLGGAVVMPMISVLNLSEVIVGTDYFWRGCGVALLGMVSGTGVACGILAQVDASDTALLNMIMNGIYTIVASLVICLFYAERPATLQLFGAMAVVVGVFLIEGMRPSVRPTEEGLVGPLPQQITSPPKVGFRKYKGLLLSVLAGVFWGVGALGQRVGVEKTDDDLLKTNESCITTLVWTCGCFFPSMCGSACVASRGKEEIQRDALQESCWWQRYWTVVIFLGGALSGTASIFCTYSLALSAGNNSALLMMICNGSFCLLTFLFISFAFCESVVCGQLMGAVLVLAGILLTGAH